jgi:hypothetical protein
MSNGSAFRYCDGGFNSSFFESFYNSPTCAYFLHIPYAGAFMDNKEAREYIFHVIESSQRYEHNHAEATEKVLITDFKGVVMQNTDS